MDNLVSLQVTQETLVFNSEMSSSEGNVVRQLQKHTECSICMTTFTDPRILPCHHTFCLKCLENTASSSCKRPGDKLPCPNCRKFFTLPSTSYAGLMRDFKMNSLIAMANDAVVSSTTTHINCDRHKTKPLDAYCIECEKPVCILCFTDNHQGHKATDYDAVREIFSKELANYVRRISNYKQLTSHLLKELHEKKKRYLREIKENKSEILKRRKELIDRIERNTKSLLEELSSLEARHLAETEKEIEDLLKQCAISENYQTYYEATVKKASLVDICRVKEELPIVVEKLDDWYKTRTTSSFKVLLQLQDKIEIDLKSESSNIIGGINGTTKVEDESSIAMEKKVIVVGLCDNGWGQTDEMFEFNLSQPNEISKLQPAPTKMQSTAVAFSFDDKLLLIGIGEDYNEIWKFERMSGWKKCANLDQGIFGHCANIVDTSLYICGGWNPFSRKILKSVEACDLQTNKCSTVGELVHAVYLSACVAYRGLIYIFGGFLDGVIRTDCIQIFNTTDKKCSLFSKPMPSPQTNLRALSWNNSVILFNDKTCFTFDFETEIWQKREQFKTGAIFFGLVHDNEKVYVFGGRTYGSRKFVMLFKTWTSTDEIKCVRLDDIIEGNMVEWKLHGRLPKPTKIYAYT